MESFASDRSGPVERRLATRVLIADDTSSSRELLRSILESSGYQVSEAEDGEQVMEKAAAFGPHVIILDLQMPKLDGYSTAQCLRAVPAFQSVPIVALTAAFSEAIPEKIAQAGFTGFLVKPIGPARLRKYIADLL